MDVAVIGAGPAGLMAAERLTAGGAAVTVFERMPSPARKFLMAGRGGLNLTHSEPTPAFLARYGPACESLRPAILRFPPAALTAWSAALGQETYVGTSGRVFPTAMKASPLLRAWLARLRAQGVSLRTRHEWRGWTADGALRFVHSDGRLSDLAQGHVRADAVVLALGGASWPRLGSDGAWAQTLAARGASLTPFTPANCGFQVAWSPYFRERFAGTPLKTVTLRFGDHVVRGEAMITTGGLEGGGVYALAAAMREAIATQGSARLEIDLRPDLSRADVERRLAASPRSRTLSNRLRQAAGLTPAAIAMLRESDDGPLPGDSATDPAALADRVKRLGIRLSAPASLARAISTAGGVRFADLDAQFGLRCAPGVFLAGEMLDWEAPTGGYLLQACFATGAAAAQGALDYLAASGPLRVTSRSVTSPDASE